MVTRIPSTSTTDTAQGHLLVKRTRSAPSNELLPDTRQRRAVHGRAMGDIPWPTRKSSRLQGTNSSEGATAFILSLARPSLFAKIDISLKLLTRAWTDRCLPPRAEALPVPQPALVAFLEPVNLLHKIRAIADREKRLDLAHVGLQQRHDAVPRGQWAGCGRGANAHPPSPPPPHNASGPDKAK